ncbi:translation initiation factor IF-3 [candidate division CPR3 bacterium GWF2_35_18]|nr:MAG: translation initiation factor IF-3 [candidate division CPR3 bacterium GWF2_35_18]OGB65373.1 MAG: translation initiation factor IF-3 [candidate division CPR3 bacterium RIFOXYA2_FULL_35_13]OGB76262.1 MAG: translation initiation factor IF-3 [candidate division CPR3 bacterium RIFOXYC2_FULL_35_7]OGB78269.1 MAG: translation initiation factor IF-3 [candidate division CPR3 bacterium RIFOXYB2_FULL_35_8]
MRPKEQFFRKNLQIKADKVRLIGQDGKQVGVVSLKEALDYAYSRELDLIEISANANPPVCKAISLDKFKYELQQKEKKAKKKQKEVELKQFRLKLNISPHDLEIRLNRMTEFMKKGNKIKVSLFFRGRENTKKELGYELMQKILDFFGDKIQIEKPPLKQGGIMICIFGPNAKSAIKS